MAYSDDKKLEIRERVRLEDLVRDYNILLQPAGGANFRALCPFHAEKTPSLSVHVDRQFFHCFGCKAGGDIFTFVQKMENVTFPEAMEMLARRAGVILEHTRGGGGSRGLKPALYDALSCAEEYFHRLLLTDAAGEPARQYLLGRGIRRETWERFRLGYSLPTWDGLLRYAVGKGLREDILEKAGLLRQSQATGSSTGPSTNSSTGASRRRLYDAFRGRLMFPIADGQKRIVGFGARTLGDDQPKYLNTPKTPVFDKSQVLYGLPQARAAIDRGKRVAIAEGYTDVIAAHQEGIEFFVASLGTAFTAENARRLRRLAPRVDLVFDGDLAGQGAADRSLSLLVSEDLDVYVFSLSRGEDPFDTIMALGGKGFIGRLDAESMGIFEFKWRRTVGAVEASEGGAAATARALDEVLDLLVKVPNVVARKLHLKDFAENLGISAEDVERRLKRRSTRPSSEWTTSNARGGRFSTAATASCRDAGSSRRIGNAPLRPDGMGRGGGIERPGASGDLLAVPTAADNPSLEEVILEILLTEPDRALSRWQSLPDDIFASPQVAPELRAIAAGVGRQLQEGTLNVETLVTFINDPEGMPRLAAILGRIDQERLSHERAGAARVGGDVTDGSVRGTFHDTDEIWDRCLREVERKALLSRRSELTARVARLRAAGVTEELIAAEREYRELLRIMARCDRS